MTAGCESMNLGGADRNPAMEVPANGLLGAKFKALEYAMDNLPEEDRKYVDSDYSAYGIFDRDPLQQQAMVRLFAGRTPPVVDSSVLYQRSSNSQWFDGQPALKWTAAAEKVPGKSDQVDVVVGWMQSQIINEFTSYRLQFDGAAWTILDVEIVPTDGAP